MKKLFVSALASFMAVNSLSCAAEESINIDNIYVDNGTVYVESANSTDKNAVLTLRIIKNDEKLNMREKLYSVLQVEAEPGESIVFDIPIPDERLGVRGSGKYTVSVQNENGTRDEESFNYEDPEGVMEFIDDINNAIDSVDKDDEAWEALKPLFDSEKCQGVMFAKGIDYESYSSCDEEIKKEALNAFYTDSKEGLTTETFSELFSNALGLGLYNAGEYIEGVKALNAEYNGEKADHKYIEDVVERMDKSYESSVDLNNGFKTAYGIVEICKAKVDEMKECLRVFADETDECESIINKIEKLSTMKRYIAYEYIAELPDSQLTSVDELEDALEKAYEAATESTSSGGSGGGGGGASGSVSNRAPVSGGSVSSATGSGTPDMKVEDTVKPIFADLTDDHWAAEAVISLKDKGIINGTDEGAFEPDRAVTREEFTKMLVTACNIKTDEYNISFSDTKDGEWYIPYIGAATEKGIVKGIGDNLFGIGEKITRQDMAVMAERAADTCGYNIDKIKDYTVFADEAEIAGYAKDSIKRFFEGGIINGKENNRFDPYGNATRAEAAKIIYEAFVK